MADRGVIYMLLGTRHAVVAAVSIRSMRQQWSGPILILAEETAMPIASKIALASDSEVRAFAPKAYKRNTGYSAKPTIPAMSPFRQTIQIDADTLVIDDLDGLWPERDDLLVLTRFSKWVSNERPIAGRIMPWEQHGAEKELARCLANPYPAVNTGIVAYGCESTAARDDWQQYTNLWPDVFMSDELAAQLALPGWRDARKAVVLPDCWNWSPKYGAAAWADVRIIHFHGKKHLRPEAQPLWLPDFAAAVDEDYASIQSWLPAGDKRLKAFVAEHGGLDSLLRAVEATYGRQATC